MSHSTHHQEEVEQAQLIFNVEDEEQEDLSQNRQETPKIQHTMVNPFAGIEFPVLCDVFDQLRVGNCLPLILLMNKKADLDLKAVDMYGYAPIHYAVVQGNLELIELITKQQPDSVSTLSRHWQTPLMIACNTGNSAIVRHLVQRLEALRLDDIDQWGFNALTYCVKANNIASFCYLLANGARLDRKFKDLQGFSMAHWAAQLDRVFFLRLFFRAGFDLSMKDKKELIPFERALANWSLHSIQFYLETSTAPLETHKYLTGGSKQDNYLLPRFTRNELNQMQSEYIPETIKSIQARKALTNPEFSSHIHTDACRDKHGLLDSLPEWEVLVHKLETWADRPPLFRYRRRLVSVVGLSSFILFLFCFYFYLSQPYLLHFALLVAFQTSLYSLAVLSSPKPLLDNEESTELDDEEDAKEKLRVDLSHYYVSPQLMARGIKYCGESLFTHFAKLFDKEKWEEIRKPDEMMLCGVCLIRRNNKVRHCPTTNICIAKYHCRLNWLGVVVDYRNEGTYLLFVLATSFLVALVFYALLPQMGDHHWSTIWFRGIYELWITGNRVVSIFCIWLVYLTFYRVCDSLIFLYSISAGLTLDELTNPRFYPYLFKESRNIPGKFTYDNPGNKGFIMNWVIFMRQLTTSKPIFN